MSERDETTSNPVAIPATMPGLNGGTLRRGGVNPGAGRPPSQIRAAMRESLSMRIRIAEEIADDEKATQGDRLRALDFLAKYGIGTTSTATDTEGNDVQRPGRLTKEQREARLKQLLTEIRN